MPRRSRGRWSTVRSSTGWTVRSSTLTTWSEISRAHDDGGFDRVLVGYGAVGARRLGGGRRGAAEHRPPRGAGGPSAGHSCSRVLLARMAATLDHLTGGGRIAIHFITGGDEADQRREGDFVPHDARYGRTGEVMSIVRRIWSEDAPFDFDGEFFRYEGAFSSVKPVTPGGIPLYFAGASPPAIDVGAAQADVYAFWGEPRAAVAARMETIGKAAAEGRPILALQHLPPADHRRHRGGGVGEGRVDRGEDRRTDRAGQGTDEPATRRPTRAWAAPRTPRSRSIVTPGARTSVGRKRLIEMSADQDVYDERLWMKVANLTGAAGNSTALVGTPEQVAEAMLRYYDLGHHHLAAEGLRPAGRRRRVRRTLLPLVREGAELRDAAGVR